MEPRTHLAIDPGLCGRVLELAPGRAVVALEARRDMAADERGLLHGGFTFGLADYAAMMAVNEPTVVLVSADLRFLKPVVVGDRVEAEAEVVATEGKKRRVKAVVRRNEEAVLEGELVCVVPERHVLDGRGAR
jgi:uncharacterized protein (TIGR00369 family)